MDVAVFGARQGVLLEQLGLGSSWANEPFSHMKIYFKVSLFFQLQELV